MAGLEKPSQKKRYGRIGILYPSNSVPRFYPYSRCGPGSGVFVKILHQVLNRLHLFNGRIGDFNAKFIFYLAK